MAVRTYPTKRFGNVPKLDKFIKRGKKKDPDARFFVNGTPFSNLTLARHHVADQKKIEVDEEYSGISEYDPNQKGKHHRPGLVRAKHAKKMTSAKRYEFSIKKKDVIVAISCDTVEEIVAITKKFMDF